MVIADGTDWEGGWCLAFTFNDMDSMSSSKFTDLRLKIELPIRTQKLLLPET